MTAHTAKDAQITLTGAAGRTTTLSGDVSIGIDHGAGPDRAAMSLVSWDSEAMTVRWTWIATRVDRRRKLTRAAARLRTEARLRAWLDAQWETRVREIEATYLQGRRLADVLNRPGSFAECLL